MSCLHNTRVVTKTGNCNRLFLWNQNRFRFWFGFDLKPVSLNRILHNWKRSTKQRLLEYQNIIGFCKCSTSIVFRTVTLKCILFGNFKKLNVRERQRVTTTPCEVNTTSILFWRCYHDWERFWRILSSVNVYQRSYYTSTKDQIDISVPCPGCSTCQTWGMQLQQLKRGSGILNFWQRSLSRSSPS